jgi:hypothetical protein
MRISYSLMASEATLFAHIIGETAPVYSPYVEDQDLEIPNYVGSSSTVTLGNLVYRQLDKPNLPPVLLLEPLNDPLTAERDCEQGGRYRYIGLFLLPNGGLGERANVYMTQDARALYLVRQEESEKHQQALARRQTAIAELFRIKETDLPVKTLSAFRTPDADIRAMGAELEQGDVHRQLQALTGLTEVDPLSLPLCSLFPCLNNPSQEVRDRTIALLAPVAPLLPIDQLEKIADQADLPARIAAIRLLGKSRAVRAHTILLSTRWRAHSWERIASLYGLVELNQDREEVIIALKLALKQDPVPEVRAIANQLFAELGDH